MKLQVERFTIRNGQVPCQFEFISKPDENTYCKEWLTANPSKGFLLSGELLLLSHVHELMLFPSGLVPSTLLRVLCLFAGCWFHTACN